MTPDALVADLDRATALLVNNPTLELASVVAHRWTALQAHLADGGDLPYVWARARPDRALTADEAVSVEARAGAKG